MSRRTARYGLFFACAFLAPEFAAAPPEDAPKPPDAFRLLKRFDFDERKNGNFESTPMHWQRLSGPGLPAYSRGVLDEEVGRDAPPAFRLALELGSVAYEYGHTDLDVLPGAAYRVVGYVRTRGIVDSRAFVAAFLTNRDGERIDASLRVSELASDAHATDDGWQRVTLDLAGHYPEAAALRLQVWVLQTDVWRATEGRLTDAIPRQDVQAEAWFDDISIYVVPQTQLRFSDPANLVRPGESAALIVEVDNATGRELPVDLRIVDEDGREAFRHRLAVQAGSQTPVEFPLPPLPPGAYTATLRPEVEFDVPLERRLRFAVLPELPRPAPYSRDLAVDLSAWPVAHAAAVAPLLTNLNACAAKLRVPLLGVIDSDEKRTVLSELSAMLQAFAAARLDVVGVIAPPDSDTRDDNSLRAYCEANPDWPAAANPILAQLGGRISTWQLGVDEAEWKSGGSWSRDAIERVRAHVLRFNSLPEVVVPVSGIAEIPPGPDVRSIWMPFSVPASQLAASLSFLASPDEAPRWVTVEADPAASVSPRDRIVDLARRVVLAKALAPDRVFVAAPFAPRDDADRTAWEPTDAYVPLRTLFHYLSGRRAAAVARLEPDGVLILFRDDSETGAHCAVAWTWSDAAAETPVALQLGPAAASVDLWGRRRPLEQRDGRALLLLSPTPAIIECVDLSAALIATTFRVQPTHVSLHDPNPRPVLSFRNGAGGRIAGEIEVTPPDDWQVEPQRVRFELAPGEALEMPLNLTLPRRLLRAADDLDVKVDVEGTSPAQLNFVVPLTIGLGDVEMDVSAAWRGDALVVRQTLRNRSGGAVSFDGFCQPPQRSRMQHAFLRVEAGDAVGHAYVFEDARELVGTRVHVGIREIRGDRVVERLVDVPP